MGEALKRPWHSEFDLEYFDWEENRSLYIGITPDHGNESWKVSTTVMGKRFCKTCASLHEALEAINTFRQSAGEGK